MIRKFKGEALYLERERDFSKTASIKVGKNPSEWPTEIIEMLHEQHPYLADSNIQISMKKTDEDSGAGLGSIVIDDKAMIPLVIDSNKVASLDMFYDGDQLFPMTRDRIESASRGTAMGKPVTPSKGEVTDSSLVQSTHPPYDGKYTFASSLDYSKQEFSDAINRTFSYEGFVAEMANPVWKEAISEFLSHSGGVTKTASSSRPRLVKKASSVYTAPKHNGVYEVVTEKGPMVGMYVSSLQKFAEHNGHSGLFINTATGQYSKLDDNNLAAREVSQLPQVKLASLSGKGVFVVPGETHGVTVTDPIEIKFKNGDHYEAVDEYGRRFALYKSAEFTAIETAGRVIGVPEKAVFVPVSEHIKLANPRTLDLGANRIEFSRIGDKYFAKTASQLSTLESLPSDGAYLDEMLLALEAHFDASAVSGELRKLANRSSFVATWESLKPTMAKVATIHITEDEKKAMTKVASFFDAKTLGIIKLSQDQGKKTVDTLLGLNFVGPANMQKFVEKLETISQARQAVGELLLASRLGLDIDQMPLKTAFQALDKIESELRQLRTMESAV